MTDGERRTAEASYAEAFDLAKLLSALSSGKEASVVLTALAMLVSRVHVLAADGQPFVAMDAYGDWLRMANGFLIADLAERNPDLTNPTPSKE